MAFETVDFTAEHLAHLDDEQLQTVLLLTQQMQAHPDAREAELENERKLNAVIAQRQQQQ